MAKNMRALAVSKASGSGSGSGSGNTFCLSSTVLRFNVHLSFIVTASFYICEYLVLPYYFIQWIYFNRVISILITIVKFPIAVMLEQCLHVLIY